MAHEPLPETRLLGFVGGSVDPGTLGLLRAGQKRAHDADRVVTEDLGNGIHTLRTGRWDRFFP